MAYFQPTFWPNSTPQTPQQLGVGRLRLTDAEVILDRNCFTPAESDILFANLLQETNWAQDTIALYGRTVPLPRLTAWYGDRPYTYSGITMHPEPWTATLLAIKTRIETCVKFHSGDPLNQRPFNSVLLNLYRNGRDSVAWHSDDEPELGRSPVIASVSFGGTRRFSLKHKHRKAEQRVDINLPSGSLLLMQGETQTHWLHQVPKTTKPVQPRINLTFRRVVTF